MCYNFVTCQVYEREGDFSNRSSNSFSFLDACSHRTNTPFLSKYTLFLPQNGFPVNMVVYERMVIMKKFLIFLCVLALIFAFPISTSAAESTPKIPVLLYHVVSSSPSNDYQISITTFKQHMLYLKNNGYTTLSLDEFYDIIYNNAKPPKKPVLLTFDDGTADFNTTVVPFLSSYGMKATQFPVANWIDGPGMLTSEQIKTLKASGIDIQNHTTTHDDMVGKTEADLRSMINGATEKIKSITGDSTTFLAYPYGSFDGTTVSVLKDLGFKGAFKVGGGFCTPESDKFALPRTVILRDDDLYTFIRKVKTGN